MSDSESDTQNFRNSWCDPDYGVYTGKRRDGKSDVIIEKTPRPNKAEKSDQVEKIELCLRTLPTDPAKGSDGVYRVTICMYDTNVNGLDIVKAFNDQTGLEWFWLGCFMETGCVATKDERVEKMEGMEIEVKPEFFAR